MLDSTAVQSVTPTSSPTFWESVAKNFHDCGDFRWVLLAVLLFALAVTIERVIFFYIGCRRVNPVTAGEAAKAIEDDAADAYVLKNAKRNDPLSVLVKVALSRFNDGESLEQIQEGIDEEAVMQVPRFSARLSYLALFANIATLLGLLGTIAGLQEAFSSLEGQEAARKSAMLAAGISKAMNTTAFGLIIAIPCMALYTFLNNKQKVLIRSLDDAMLRLFNYIRRKKQ